MNDPLTKLTKRVTQLSEATAHTLSLHRASIDFVGELIGRHRHLPDGRVIFDAEAKHPAPPPFVVTDELIAYIRDRHNIGPIWIRGILESAAAYQNATRVSTMDAPEWVENVDVVFMGEGKITLPGGGKAWTRVIGGTGPSLAAAVTDAVSRSEEDEE